MGVKPPSVKEYLAKQAITEVIYRYCRGMDRMDKELTLSCWHPGGTDDHAPLYYGDAEGFIEWLWPVHEAMIATRHSITNILINVDGDRATAESYRTTTLRVRQGDDVVDMIADGRYLDKFECIDGIWAIRHRISVLDIERLSPVLRSIFEMDEPLMSHANNRELPQKLPARDKTDISYEYVKD